MGSRTKAAERSRRDYEHDLFGGGFIIRRLLYTMVAHVLEIEKASC